MKTTDQMPAKVKKALSNLLIARRKWEKINTIDTATHKEILSENTYRESETGELITEQRSDFLMSESDFEDYCRKVYARNLEKGIDSGSWEFNFWDCKKAMYDAEDALIEAAADGVPVFTPELILKTKQNQALREKFLSTFGF